MGVEEQIKIVKQLRTTEDYSKNPAYTDAINIIVNYATDLFFDGKKYDPVLHKEVESSVVHDIVSLAKNKGIQKTNSVQFLSEVLKSIDTPTRNDFLLRLYKGKNPAMIKRKCKMLLNVLRTQSDIKDTDSLLFINYIAINIIIDLELY